VEAVANQPADELGDDVLSHGVLPLEPGPGPQALLPVVSVLAPHLRTTSLVLAVRYGARHDPAGAGGLAHLLEHLLMSSEPSFCEAVERLGGYANAETGLEHMLYTAQVHADDTEAVLDLLCRAVLSPRVSAADLDRERAVVLQEIAAAKADPGDEAQEAFLAALLPGHPLGRPVAGTAEEIGALSLADIVSGHRDLFLPSNRALIVVGPRRPAGFVPGPPARWAGGDAVPVAASKRADEPTPGWADEFSWVCLGARAAPFGDPKAPAFVVLQHLFGGSPSSLTYRRIRGEHGLAYAFQAWYRGYTEVGSWRLLMGVEPENGDEAVKLARELLEDVAREGPSVADLSAAVKQAQMSILLTMENPFEFAAEIAYRTRAGTLTWDPGVDVAALGEVTAERVAEAAATIRDGLLVTVRPSLDAGSEV
jgi:predicted Zn-dependent peptidase